ncbi:MAG: hypothetical protein J7K90_03165, partial [Desulfuromusa sp.]|nr:hypothetical protein [Desulfuromusa sp.]
MLRLFLILFSKLGTDTALYLVISETKKAIKHRDETNKKQTFKGDQHESNHHYTDPEPVRRTC